MSRASVGIFPALRRFTYKVDETPGGVIRVSWFRNKSRNSYRYLTKLYIKISSWREGAFGKRAGDPAIEIYKQATLGDVDFITGDYLAEVNIAQNAEAFALGSHPGFETSELKGLEKTLDAINDKRIKVAINGGALNPKGLAEKVALLFQEKRYVTGDNLRH
ncbi:hypothetical protein J3459_014742 [Metarhizium acridum]|uniref:uncharacterized protein n=1 Tax=Metarhizium acridum TaxID=92637 RepID=UPI001C6C8907|nr:hypothetical protein J3458_014428 [Metarhizium acridum]KAG8414442.1 hypothetical protein J3459_014742 [Metarhizium acridum]